MPRSMLRVLTIAGTDPLGGAGILADAAAIRENGGEALAVPTALVDQDSTGVRRFLPVPEDLFVDMTRSALVDGRPHALKVGMTATARIARRLRELRQSLAPTVPMVVDPVLQASSGDPLASSDLVAALRALVDHHTLLTPNACELSRFLESDRAVQSPADLATGAAQLAGELHAAVFAKGGHVTPPGGDVLAMPSGELTHFDPGPSHGADIHGTGCHLSAAIATRLAAGDELVPAIRAARAWLQSLVASGRVGLVGTARPQFLHASGPLPPGRGT